MGHIKEINIKNQTYYFFDVIINIKDFDSNLLIWNGNKYLILISRDKTKEVLIKYTELWDKFKNLIKK